MPERFPRSTTTSPAGGRIPPMESYPRSVSECVEERTYQRETVAAIREYRRSKPWRGSLSERTQKLRRLHSALCTAYGLTTDLICSVGDDDAGSSGGSHYSPSRNRITLTGRLSVITYLHEFGHALGYGEQGACRWSINLFRRFFPRSYSRLQAEGHTLIRPRVPIAR